MSRLIQLALSCLKQSRTILGLSASSLSMFGLFYDCSRKRGASLMPQGWTTIKHFLLQGFWDDSEIPRAGLGLAYESPDPHWTGCGFNKIHNTPESCPTSVNLPKCPSLSGEVVLFNIA